MLGVSQTGGRVLENTARHKTAFLLHKPATSTCIGGGVYCIEG